MRFAPLAGRVWSTGAGPLASAVLLPENVGSMQTSRTEGTPSPHHFATSLASRYDVCHKDLTELSQSTDSLWCMSGEPLAGMTTRREQ